MNLHHKSTYNLKIPSARREDFFFPLPLLRTNGGVGLWIEAPSLVGYISLLCKLMWGFYLAVLNTWAQVLLVSHSSSQDTLNGNIRLGKQSSRRSSMGLSFSFFIKAEVEIPSFGCLLPFFPMFFPRLLFRVIHENSNLKSFLKLSSRWISVLCSLGQLCSEPAAYLEGWIAAAGILKSFCLHKHLGPLEAEQLLDKQNEHNASNHYSRRQEFFSAAAKNSWAIYILTVMCCAGVGGSTV